MPATTFIDNAKVMAKGQITIPKDIRDILGVSNGDRVTFIVEDGSVRLVNAAVFAMNTIQKQMRGEAERAGIQSEKDVMDIVKKNRYKKADH